MEHGALHTSIRERLRNAGNMTVRRKSKCAISRQKQSVIRGKRIDHGDQRFAGLIRHDQIVIGAIGRELQLAQFFAQPRGYELVFGFGEIQSALLVRELAKLFEFALRRAGGVAVDPLLSNRGLPHHAVDIENQSDAAIAQNCPA